jgi:hypothetical protein
MTERFHRLGTTFALAVTVLLWGNFTHAEPVDEETMAFLKRNAPATLKAIELQGREGGEEDLKEAHKRAFELREMFLEAKAEFGEYWAEVRLGLEDVEAEIEVLAWRFEEGEIGEDEGETTLMGLLKKQIALLNESDRMEIERLGEDSDELEEELAWRIDC